MNERGKFHDMTEMQRAGWLAWADSHDWGAGAARYTENIETGKISMHVECGDWVVETYLAGSVDALRGWAGY